MSNSIKKPTPQKSILCVWLPNWPIQKLVAANDELRKTQIVLYRNQPGRGQIVSAISPAAKASGTQIGMPLSEARSLVGRSRKFAGHHIFEHNPSADLRELQQLAIDCQEFSPIVGLEESEQPDSLLMDVSGLTHLFGGNDGLRSRLHQHFQSRGLLVSSAIAHTIGMAWAIAKFGEGEMRNAECGTRNAESEISNLKSQISNSSTAQAEPRPPVSNSSLPTSDFRSPIPSSLPVQALRLSPLTVDTLQQLGINQISHIRSLPRAGLRSRFGDEITRRLDQADGIIDEVIRAIYPPADYQVEKYLDYPVTDRETILVLVKRLADQLCKQMRSAGRGGLVWQFQLNGPPEQRTTDSGVYENDENENDEDEKKPTNRRNPGSHHQLTVKLFQPTASLDHLMPLVKMQMEDLFRGSVRRRKSCNSRSNRKAQRKHGQQFAFEVQEVVVSVRNCVLLAERQRQLFDENPRLDKQTLTHLINRLSSRLGAEHVLRPVLQSGTQAEDNFFFEPLVGHPDQNKNRKRRTQRSGNALSPLQRPLTLYPTPIPITTVSVDGASHRSSNIPATFLCDQQQINVQRRWGPERIETAWWRGPTVRRDYWRIETGQQRWLWIYRDLQMQKWFLHGEF